MRYLEEEAPSESKGRNMRVFRGTNDVVLSEINHRYIGDKVYGKATYFGLSEDVAYTYVKHAKRYRIIIQYECAPANPLHITKDEIPKLKLFTSSQHLSVSPSLIDALRLKEETLQSYKLSQLAHRAGYDSIILTGEVYGGEQLVIPARSKLVPAPLSASVWIHFSEERFGARMSRHLEASGLRCDAEENWVKASAASEGEVAFLSNFLDFHSRLGGESSIREIDFKEKRVAYLDE